MTDEELDEISIRRTKALKKSMKKTNDDYWDSKKEVLKTYSLAEQEYIKAMVTSTAGARLAGFNKKEYLND
jgi:DNA-binding TFAR19-related protein (PDSD5 family)